MKKRLLLNGNEEEEENSDDDENTNNNKNKNKNSKIDDKKIKKVKNIIWRDSSDRYRMLVCPKFLLQKCSLTTCPLAHPGIRDCAPVSTDSTDILEKFTWTNSF